MIKEKNPLITFPVQINLNENGEHYFSRMGVPLKTVTGINGRKKLGFQAPNIEVPFIKSLLRQNFFEEIYAQSITLIDKKEQVQDITKLIFYGIIYNKFRPHVTEVLLASDLIEKYNFKNPGHKITHDTKFNESKIKEFFSLRKNVITGLINNILEKPFQVIDKDKDIKEKDEKKNILKTLLQHISLKEWFLFFLITTSQEERTKVIAQISDLMIIYLGKTKISDYLGFLLIELVQNAEKASLTKIAQRKIKENVDDFLKDKGNRDVLINLAKEMKYHIEISWKMKYLEGGSSLNNVRYEIMVSNRGVIPKNVRKNVKEKSQKDVTGYSLGDFYQDSGQSLGAGLGLFYISYITEESIKQNIRFDSSIDSDDDKDTTYVILRVIL
jgi:hypothetical protein